MLLERKRILVTGSRGMLALELIPILQQAGAEIIAHDLATLDITNAPQVAQVIRDAHPDWIVNCAAYTAVDDAEKQYAAAFAVNAIGPANIAKAIKDTKIKLLHLSTDYLFGSGERVPFSEEAACKPCGIYGHSKYFGEEQVRLLLPQTSLIVRTSWLHGIFGKNFIDTMLRVGKENPQVRVVDDQFGSPTWTGWLAETLVELIAKDATGLFHASSRGGISWFEFAKEIFQQAGMSTKVEPQSTEELARPAPRPAYSVLSVSKLEKFLGKECISWKACISNHLAARNNQGAP